MNYRYCEYFFMTLLLSTFLVTDTLSKKFKENEKPSWARKELSKYSDADYERLLEQWEEDDEPLEDDELPEHLRPQPKIDFSQIKEGDPESILKLSKKGKTLMVFVQVESSLSRDKTEEVTKIWQSGLYNNHIQAERYLVDDNRAIFLFKDGSQAWEAKDFIIDQLHCKDVTIENKVYPGKHVAVKGTVETVSRDEL